METAHLFSIRISSTVQLRIQSIKSISIYLFYHMLYQPIQHIFHRIGRNGEFKNARARSHVA